MTAANASPVSPEAVEATARALDPVMSVVPEMLRALSAERVRLEQQVQRLTEEVARITSDRDAKTARMWELGHECDRLAEEVEKARASLRTYGQHRSMCEVVWKGGDCTCGLEAALTPADSKDAP
jgi:chromosome segregation ATPase